MFEPCPCGRPATYLACCARLHSGQVEAPDAETLMRARYSAYVKGDAAFLRRSWAPETRPADLASGSDRAWAGLRVEAAQARGPDAAVVRFAARYREGGVERVLRETSRFRRDQGRWLYVDGDLD